MDLRTSRILHRTLPGLYMAGALLYISFVIRPVFYFHHTQPPFLLSPDFFAACMKETGGLSQYLALLFLQAFHSPVLGPLVLFSLATAVWVLSLQLMNRINRHPSNLLLALFPFTLAIVLFNNYNFPFSVLVSMIFMLFFLWPLAAFGKTQGKRMLLFTPGALLIFFISGGAYLMLYALISLILAAKGKDWKSLLSLLWIAGVAFLIPLLAGGDYLWLFASKPYFIAYVPGAVFYFFLFSIPLLLLIISFLPGTGHKVNIPFLAVSAALAGLALISHLLSFRPDAKKIVASDFYCYHHNAEKTSRAATTLENYSFAANVNHHLAMSRRGTLTQNFFDFFQIRGSDALFPDVDFSPEMLLIAADFYYDLAYISEARHHAYEALVFYPHSPRALQLLLKVHLVCGEYKAAGRCLRILERGLVSKRVVEEFKPYVEDPAFIASNAELMEKRNFMPAEKELSPFIDQRFRDLLEANPGNRLAREYLMLYHLLEGELEPFLELYKKNEIPGGDAKEIYEEAILMYGIKTLTKDVAEKYQVSQASLDRFAAFGKLVEQYEGDPVSARNVLYWEMGQSYFYYLGFLLPRIVKPERAKEAHDEAPI